MITLEKQYRTRGNQKTRVYCTDGGGKYPVHGAVWDEEKQEWITRTWTLNGVYRINFESDIDLIEIKPKIKGWLNVYEINDAYFYTTRKEADKKAVPGRIACIQIEFEEGEGL